MIPHIYMNERDRVTVGSEFWRVDHFKLKHPFNALVRSWNFVPLSFYKNFCLTFWNFTQPNNSNFFFIFPGEIPSYQKYHTQNFLNRISQYASRWTTTTNRQCWKWANYQFISCICITMLLCIGESRLQSSKTIEVL